MNTLVSFRSASPGFAGQFSVGVNILDSDKEVIACYPSTHGRNPVPSEVPPDLAEDYNEACIVLRASAKASAALSRRCLQALLHQQGFTQKDLAPAIDATLASRSLPSHLADDLHAIRNIGNFAAHALKSTSTGEILPVEPHEAEWNLEVLEGLFDYYYVQPAKAAARRATLNAKLVGAGRPPMKLPGLPRG